MKISTEYKMHLKTIQIINLYKIYDVKKKCFKYYLCNRLRCSVWQRLDDREFVEWTVLTLLYDSLCRYVYNSKRNVIVKPCSVWNAIYVISYIFTGRWAILNNEERTICIRLTKWKRCRMKQLTSKRKSNIEKTPTFVVNNLTLNQLSVITLYNFVGKQCWQHCSVWLYLASPSVRGWLL